MSNIISGKSGTVKFGSTPVVVPNVAQWTLEPKVVANAHASNSTSGWKTRSAGVKDATGKLKIYQTDGSAPAVIIGETYDCQLHTDATGNNYYSGKIMIEGFGGMTVDMNEGKEVTYEYSFGASGPLAANGNVPPLVPAS
jgi:hypothetical protein